MDETYKKVYEQVQVEVPSMNEALAVLEYFYLRLQGFGYKLVKLNRLRLLSETL